MSELMNASNTCRDFRWQLLTTVSALALLGSVYAASQSEAADQDGDRPTVWIELGGQLEGLNTNEEQFAPHFLFVDPRPVPETISPLSVEHAPRFSNGGEGRISFEPDSSNWVFTAAIRYGRSNASKGLHQQSYPTRGIPQIQPVPTLHPSSDTLYPRKALQFIDAQRQSSESHALLDFHAGKDLGLGMFGAGSSSIFSLGVRFAQFASKSNVAFKSDPDAHPTYKYLAYGSKFHRGGIYHFNAATAATTRSFHGVGPSLSWNASVPILGSPQEGQVKLDWGVNAAVLFGRQRASVHHQTTAQYHKGKYTTSYGDVFRTTLYRNTPPDQIRSRFVTVPNIGGFAGASFRYSIAKISVGYRADFFFGAMDGGIDAAKKENRGFYGPFATVSVGLGG